MNTDRLRCDLAELAEEVSPVDLRDRSLRTSRRLGIQRAVATSAAAVVLLGAATGTAFALTNRNASGPAPATTATATADPTPTASEPTPTPTASTNHPMSPSGIATEPAAVLGTIYYYDDGNPVTGHLKPGQLWKKTLQGPWRLVKTAADDGMRVKVPSPDGRLLAWFEQSSSVGVLKVSNLDGSQARTVASLTDRPGCNFPLWTSSSRLVLGSGSPITFEAIDIDGGNRRTIVTGDVSCEVAPAADNTLAYLRKDGKLALASSGGASRTVPVRLPAGLEIKGVVAVSADGKRALINGGTPTAGGCDCGSHLRSFSVDLSNGAAVQVALIDKSLVGVTGVGQIYSAVFLPSGGFVAQVNLANIADDPHYKLGVFAADGSLVSTLALPTAHQYGRLVRVGS